MLKMWKTCLVGAAALVFSLGAAAQAETRVQGSGATFPAPLYAKWVETFNKDNPDVKIDYQAIGSGGGIKAITDHTVQFGASDAPLSADQEKAAPGIVHLPTVAGPVVLIYNLPSVPNLKVNGEIISGIYLKEIKKWNDPKIAALNPGAQLPNNPIVVAHRSDGSGTTFIFTDFLSKVSQAWASGPSKGTAVDWPVGIAAKGNDGVTAAVKNSVGGFGYVEFAYAKKNNLTFATLVNSDGKEVQPSVDSVNASAAASMSSFPADFKVSITNASGAGAYPICGFTYLLVYQDLSYLKDKAVAQALLNYIKWAETDGQEMAAALGYAKLPKDAQDKVLEKLKTFTFDGQPLLK
jgi:phosphate transport system substrate-binding protein